ncbi:hypothetical protein A7X85_03170 [Streptomyces sp. ST1015]|nr:hypothetical protein A7X85_03170 [Streptomyces sp. ST1015]
MDHLHRQAPGVRLDRRPGGPRGREDPCGALLVGHARGQRLDHLGGVPEVPQASRLRLDRLGGGQRRDDAPGEFAEPGDDRWGEIPAVHDGFAGDVGEEPAGEALLPYRQPLDDVPVGSGARPGQPYVGELLRQPFDHRALGAQRADRRRRVRDLQDVRADPVVAVLLAAEVLQVPLDAEPFGQQRRESRLVDRGHGPDEPLLVGKDHAVLHFCARPDTGDGVAPDRRVVSEDSTASACVPRRGAGSP